MIRPSTLRSTGRRRGALLGAAVAASLVLGVAPTAAAAAAAAEPTLNAAPVGTAAAAPSIDADAKIDTRLKIDPALLAGNRTFTAFVRTSGLGALAVDASAKGGTLEDRPQSPEATARVRAINSSTRSIAAQARSIEPKAGVVYSTAYTVPGVAIVATASTFRALAARRDVVSIVPIVTKSIDPVTTTQAVTPRNAHSDVLTQAVKTWQQAGHTGTGINVAVIDTGLDYTHADFGGPGTAAAYQAALKTTSTPPAEDYDASKFKGGHDFAGATYNADPTSNSYDPFPEGDENPIDGPGGLHGTHVAGSVGGLGVDAQGKTFRGDYQKLSSDDVYKMKIGPGTAPGVGLYSLKVFGDNGGSTDLTGAALDWVGESLTRGVQINVINLSLGSDFGVADDPDNAKIDALLQQGVVPVIAQGNAGDLTDVGGSPGNAAGALTVAAATNGHSTLDGMNVLAPTDLAAAGPYGGQYSLNAYLAPDGIQGTVATLTQSSNLTGCAAFSDADAARVKGKIAWLQWDDSNVLCGSTARFDNAQAAGAIGVILTGTVKTFEGGISGNYDIPGIELTADAVAALAPAAAAGTLQVEFRGDLKGKIDVNDPSAADVIAGFSSRGEHGSYGGIVKPDVSAPGVNIVSAGAGSGNGSRVLSGTSMASPITAGITALAMQAHPTWTAAEIKADVMNTANHDVTDGGVVLDNLRQGSGRVDALQAVENNVTVTSRENGPLVTASFGVVEVARAFAATRSLVVTNRSSTPIQYTVAYRSRVGQPGVVFSLDHSSVTVPARGSAVVTLRMTILDPGALRRVINPTQSPAMQDTPRDFVAAASGLVVLTPTDSSEVPALRLPVFAAPKPVSTLRTQPVVFRSAAATTAPLTQSGGELAQGTGQQAYTGSVAPFVLGATSSAKSFPVGSAVQTLAGLDLLAVGASSTAPSQSDPAKGVLAFGIKSRGPIANPGPGGSAVVNIDVNGDRQWDFQTYTAKLQDQDSTVAVTTDLDTGATVDVKPVNENLDGGYTNLFNSTVTVLPVSLARLGYTKNTRLTTLTYQVITQSPVAPTSAAGNYQVDAAPIVRFDVFKPALWFTGPAVGGRSVVFPDRTSGITVHRKAASTARILTLHLGNSSASQANTVDATTAGTLKPSSLRLIGTPQIGRRLTVAVSGWNTPGVTVTYQWLRDGKALPGSTTATRTVVRPDLGHVLTVRVTGRKSGWNAVAVAPRGLRVVR